MVMVGQGGGVHVSKEYQMNLMLAMFGELNELVWGLINRNIEIREMLVKRKGRHELMICGGCASSS